MSKISTRDEGKGFIIPYGTERAKRSVTLRINNDNNVYTDRGVLVRKFKTRQAAEDWMRAKGLS